jgi:hypothetical protein
MSDEFHSDRKEEVVGDVLRELGNCHSEDHGINGATAK